MNSRRISAWRVTLGGRDLTRRLAPRLLDLTLTEHRGGEADELTLRIHDHDGRLALLSRGAELTAALGWQGRALVDKGKFRVDEIERSGTPDILTLRARSADLTASLRNRRERSWDQTTLGHILRAIAGEHGLTPRIATHLAEIAVPHLDQTESDANLLTRLGKRHDSVATVKAGRLLFFPIGKATNATGEPLPAVTIRRQDGDRHRYHMPIATPTAVCAPTGTTKTAPAGNPTWWASAATPGACAKPSPANRKRGKRRRPSGNASSVAWPP